MEAHDLTAPPDWFGGEEGIDGGRGGRAAYWYLSVQGEHGNRAREDGGVVV